MSKYFFVYLLFVPTIFFGQLTDSIFARIVLDTSVTVTADKYEVRDIIELLIKDSSFEQGFRGLRQVTYDNTNEFKYVDRKGRDLATYRNMLRQESVDDCFRMVKVEEQIDGKFFKRNGEHRFYTSKMFDRLFYKKGLQCPHNQKEEAPSQSDTKMEHYVAELKKLIFNPGRAVDVPLIGRKAAIFDMDMVDFYDFHLTSVPYRGVPSYFFSAKVKPKSPSGKTIIKSLDMWIDKEDMAILGKQYILRHKNLLFRFDVAMDVVMVQAADGLLPAEIRYNGMWKVPGKRSERGAFELKFSF